jgi:hypothetical protein
MGRRRSTRCFIFSENSIEMKDLSFDIRMLNKNGKPRLNVHAELHSLAIVSNPPMSTS